MMSIDNNVASTYRANCIGVIRGMVRASAPIASLVGLSRVHITNSPLTNPSFTEIFLEWEPENGARISCLARLNAMGDVEIVRYIEEAI